MVGRGEGCCQNRAKSTEEGEEEGGEGILGEGAREMQRALFRFPGRRTFSSAGLVFLQIKKSSTLFFAILKLYMYDFFPRISAIYGSPPGV